MDTTLINPFSNGYWVWDDTRNCLQFISRDAGIRSPSTMKQASVTFASKSPSKTGFEIKYRDITDKLEKLIFRRYFQRRVKPGDPDVITVQDLKDIALYIANPRDLSVEFIQYFHITTVDRFLRAAILYFQYFLDIWDFMLDRRIEEARKLRQPVVLELEDVVRDDLADLRGMLAREYLSLIGGLEDARKYHHMAGRNNDSLSEKDRRLFEMLMSMSVRVIWIALQRKHLLLIELEMNRIFRTDSFNIVTHRRNVNSLKRTTAEDRVLIGAANRFERTLLQRSPLIKEILFGEHDHRMLGAGIKVFVPSDKRIRYMEAAYTAPEEMILRLGVPIGLLGVPREEYDPILISRERTSKTYQKQPTEVPTFKLPPRVYHSDKELPSTFPKNACCFTETEQTKRARKVQCKMWTLHVKNALAGFIEATQQIKESVSHLSANKE